MPHVHRENPRLGLFAGADIGGSTTRVIVASDDGSFVGWGRGAAGNPNHVGWENAGEIIGSALTEALGSSPREAVRGVFLGVAGVISESDRDRAKAWVRSWNLPPDCRVAADHDIRIALEGGLAGRPGIALISGTGSSCYGLNAQGDTWQAGGWEAILDDLGSGYDLARRGMAATVQSADGRLPESLLRPLFFDALGVDNAIDFCTKVHRPTMARSEIAALAPLVMSAAEQGDAEALKILHEAAAELTRMASAVAAKCFSHEPVEIVLLGGLMEKAPLYRSLVKDALRQVLPHVSISEAHFSPVVGALSLAAKQTNISMSDEILSRISCAS